jgi:Tfp pilus assembly major pilin PilA
MRTRITFLAGFAAGFVAGTRAGRERYEQMVKLGRKAVENTTVRQATRAAGAKATELTKTAGQKAADRMPKLAETAKNTASTVRIPGRNSGDDDTSAVNGARPVD